MVDGVKETHELLSGGTPRCINGVQKLLGSFGQRVIQERFVELLYFSILVTLSQGRVSVNIINPLGSFLENFWVVTLWFSS